MAFNLHDTTITLSAHKRFTTSEVATPGVLSRVRQHRPRCELAPTLTTLKREKPPIMRALASCPNCCHEKSGEDPETHTFKATATARVTATITGTGDLQDYHDPEVDLSEGYRDIECEWCGHEVEDISGEDLLNAETERRQEATAQRDRRNQVVLMKVLADVNLNVDAQTAGRGVAAHVALLDTATTRGLHVHREGDETGTWIEGHVVGTEAEIVPLLASLRCGGHAYEVHLDETRMDAEEPAAMDRIIKAAAGTISYLQHASVTYPDPYHRP